MTFDTVKDKLHNYIDHADKSKVMAIYTLLSNDLEIPVYDEATLKMLETTSDNMRSGAEKTYTLDETIANIRNHRRANGI